MWMRLIGSKSNQHRVEKLYQGFSALWTITVNRNERQIGTQICLKIQRPNVEQNLGLVKYWKYTHTST